MPALNDRGYSSQTQSAGAPGGGGRCEREPQQKRYLKCKMQNTESKCKMQIQKNTNTRKYKLHNVGAPGGEAGASRSHSRRGIK